MKWTPGGDSPDIEDRRDDTRRRWRRISVWRHAHRHWRRDNPADPEFCVQNKFLCAARSGGGSVAPAPSATSDPNTDRMRNFGTGSGGKAAGAICFLRAGRHAENLDDYFAATEPTSRTGTPSWCCFATPFNPAAAARNRLLGRFIARATKKFISTSDFTTS